MNQENDMRDYATEMRQELDRATAEGPYVPRVVAGEVVDKLRATDPDLLDGWLQAQAEHFIWQAINDRDRSVRAATRHRAPRQEFSSAVTAHDQGDVTPLRKYLDMPYSVEDGSRKRLASLTRDDLQFVGATYRRRAAENALMEAFFAALAKKVKSGVVADHYSEDQVAAMFASITGRSAA